MKEDNFTHTIEDAAEYERQRSLDQEPSRRQPLWRRQWYEDRRDQDDECGCSDPCCPCSGYKLGIP